MRALRPFFLTCAAAAACVAVLACSDSDEARARSELGEAAAAAQARAGGAASAPPAFAHAEGEALVARLGCLSCHAADSATRARIRPLGAPVLASAGQMASPHWFRTWLNDPQPPDAASRMPDLLHGLPPAERSEAVEDLTHYLVSLEGPFDPMASRPDEWRIADGGVLFQRLGCFACHSDAELAARSLAAKTDMVRMAGFLRAPLASRPNCGMPDFDLSADEATALAAWLLREQHAMGPAREDLVPGVRYDYVEPASGELARLADVGDWTPTRAGLAESIGLLPGHRDDRFAYRFEGWLALGSPARITFGLESDDGSDLTINGVKVVDNDGLHAPQERTGVIDLPAGRHLLVVRMYENGGGETLEAWMQRDGGPREPLGAANLSVIGEVYAPLGHAPLAVDPARAARGAQRFASAGCLACHADPGGLPPQRPAAPTAPAFTALRPEAGCLAEAPPPAAVRYALAPEQRAALRAVVAQAGSLGAPLAAAQHVAHALERLACNACHARGEAGPTPAARARFTGEGDVGDEGRVPPSLDGVGRKLRPAWLERVLAGTGVARSHYVHARMPRFDPLQVEGLPAVFAAADQRPSAAAPAAFAADRIADGRALAGVGGLNCIQCHPVAGHPAQGMQVMDLTTMHERLEPDWFRAWLENPIAMRSATRMPVYFSGGRSTAPAILGGDARAQIEALWSWLALGDSLPLPPGLVVERSSYELVPVDRPVYVGAFMQGASARVTNVGFPERVHASFDLHHARLMQVWRGDFFNADGTWHGRAGQLQVPSGEAVRALPAGPAFARLAAADAPWPTASGKEAGWRMVAHRRDAAGRPTWSYRHGDLRVDESLEPRWAEGGAVLVRRFRVEVPPGEGDWHFRAADGPGLSFTIAGGAQAISRGAETLIPLAPGSHSFEVTLSWE